VIHALNRELRERVDPDQLVAADAVLRATIADADGRRRADLLVAPPGGAATTSVERSGE
jgi:hypothetical protein